MATGSIQDFTKKMLSESLFTCATCNNLLTVPVMMVEDVGNVCHDCFKVRDKENDPKSVPNTTLNSLLKELKFPCKFHPQGCNEDILYDNLKEHEHQCVYRLVDCLMPKNKCDWTGKLVDLLKHFKEDHSKHVLTGPFEEFSFEMNLEKVGSIIKLLSYSNRTCVLRIEKSDRDNCLVHCLQDVSVTDGDLKMVVKYVGGSSVYKGKLEASPFDATCDERYSKKIKLSALKEVSEGADTVKVVIKPGKCEFKNTNSEIMKNLECPVCKEIMRQPIFQCLTGHSICQSCHKRLSVCPTCQEDFPEQHIRNFSLEALTLFVQYECAYHQFGCTSTVLGNEIHKHEGKCKYQMYECPKKDCSFTGNYSSCKNHFQVNHNEDLVIGTAYKSNFTPLGRKMSATKQIVYFFEFGNLFELVFSRLQDYCSWTARILNNYAKDAQFFFAVYVTHPNIKQRFIATSNLCMNRDATVTDSDWIDFTYDSLTPYKSTNSDQINFRCEIFAETSS
ncbi:uncharacterized protein LOC135130959 [Zophobas morio]|uniref:uncharacterized protein LOC135130959 n=1 Tax=Zophobas morio TaxID=2755281 RepID=UPI003083D195